jgi:hypothetical protein
VNGEVIALLPENTERLTQAVASLLQNTAPKSRMEQARFDTLMKRCANVNAMLSETGQDLNEHQKANLPAAIRNTNRLAARLGIGDDVVGHAGQEARVTA